MEFSQSRLNGAQGAKPTHDFLSLYSPAQQDPTPTIPDDYRKTRDFLQPLEEEVGRNVAKSKSKSFPRTVEHSLPGGMGTYSMNHIPCMNNQVQTQKINDQGIAISSGAKSSSSNNNNNDENSNSSSYTGSGFTLWEDSNILNKGKTGKENDVGIKHMIKDGGGVPWMTSSIHNHPTTTFTSLSSSHSHPSNNRYFADTLKFGKSPQQELDDDDDQVFVIKKEPAFHHKAVKVDCGQKPNSPRSKHSATEQRRRSKINDRFSMLRGIIPHGDQKRDKASFLLEVIEYIQFLQEKVHKYEDSGQGWTDQLPNNVSSNNFRDQPMRSVDATNQQPAGSDTHISTHDTTTDCTITSDKLKDEQLIIESGTISISTTYSQGLSSALTQALKSSGVDLSQANISVQIDLGKGSNNPSPPDLKGNETVSIDQFSGEGFKRLKTNGQ